MGIECRLKKEEREQVAEAQRLLGHDRFRVYSGGKHKKLTWMQGGVECTIVIAGSPGNDHYLQNVRTSIRKHLLVRPGSREGVSSS